MTQPKVSDLPDSDDEGTPRTPEYHLSDDEVEQLEVEYSTRAPEDWVLSGPLGAAGGGPGRRFATIKQAQEHVLRLHGDRVIRRIPEATTNNGNRWAWLIRGRARTHCPAGHPYFGDNLYTAPDGRRMCRECQRIRGRKENG